MEKDIHFLAMQNGPVGRATTTAKSKTPNEVCFSGEENLHSKAETVVIGHRSRQTFPDSGAEDYVLKTSNTLQKVQDQNIEPPQW